jgi:predicted nucleic acid-binding protein
VAYFQDHPAFVDLKSLGEKMRVPITALSESYCILLKQKGRADADRLVGALKNVVGSFLSLTEKAALEAGRIRHQYHLGLGDSLIAAAALCERLPLLTFDADFQKLSLEIRVIKLQQ